MKILLVGLTLFHSFIGYAGGHPQGTQSKCVIEDYNNTISQDVKTILRGKGYRFSDSQTDSNLDLDLTESCGQGPGYGDCSISITGIIDGRNVYTHSRWVESDVNPFQSLYRLTLNAMNKSHIKNFEDCKTIIERSSH